MTASDRDLPVDMRTLLHLLSDQVYAFTLTVGSNDVIDSWALIDPQLAIWLFAKLVLGLLA
jgi:hypothetical protein